MHVGHSFSLTMPAVSSVAKLLTIGLYELSFTNVSDFEVVNSVDRRLRLCMFPETHIRDI
jgi:hypothetical protein